MTDTTKPVDETVHRTADQSEVEAFLADPATHGGVAVERIDTHAAIVFLAGDAAYKIKKAVRYSFLDFSTLERRHAICRHELARGRSIAPRIYTGVVAITRAKTGGLTLGGDGEPVEWCVEMRRFAQSAILSAHARDHGIDDALARDLGHVVAAMHERAERRDEERDGGAAAIGAVIARSIAPTLREQSGLFAAARVEALVSAMEAMAERLSSLLDERAGAGMVRLCHGDLHLANMVLLDGVPTAFDAIEFDDRLATTDVFYDLAFLIMDLWRRGHRRAANIVLTRYLEPTGDRAGLAALPLFLAMRAAIRAMVTAIQGSVDEALVYFAWAERLIAPARPRLVAIGGLSGTGKTTLAQALAPDIGPPPGAVLLRTDIERKTMLGVSETARLGADAYTCEASDAVYARLREQARAILAAGHGAIVDAVHARESEREAIELVAGHAATGFAGLWLDAPAPVLSARVSTRKDDASDADHSVVEKQLDYDLGAIGWARLDGSGAQDMVVDSAREALGIKSADEW